eukprot:6366413-Pyramimonas_sp.AAC.1
MDTAAAADYDRRVAFAIKRQQSNLDGQLDWAGSRQVAQARYSPRRRLEFSGLRRPSADPANTAHTTASSPQQILGGLQRFWQPVFSAKLADPDAVQKCFERRLPKFDCADLRVPAPEDFQSPPH